MAQVFFRVLCPKISTGLEKLAPTGWHGWHVFATLTVTRPEGIQNKVKRPGSRGPEGVWNNRILSKTTFQEVTFILPGNTITGTAKNGKQSKIEERRS